MERKESESQGVKNRKIVIGICTFLRNYSLDSTLESLLRIDLPDGVKIELLLVDNDKNGGAREVFDYYRDILPFDSHYVIEPRQGLACARNRVIEESLKLGATEIACIDDDEIASQQWLTALWNAYKDSEYSGAGGPMYRLLPPGTDEVLLKFWPNNIKIDPKKNYVMYFNNCLFSADLVHPDKMNLRFDEFFNEIGGEDSAFTIQALQMGARFVYVPEAITIERFPKKRATFRYLLKRRFGSGGLLPLGLRRAHSKRHLRIILPSMAKIALRTMFVPFSILFGRFGFWKNLAELAEAAGAFIGCFGKSYKHYTKKNIAAESQDS